MSSKKIRIALYIGSLDSGGSERHVVRLLRALPCEGFEISLFVDFKEGLLLQEVREMGIEPIEVSLVPTVSGRLHWLSKMTHYLRRGNFQILQAFNDVSIAYAGVAAALARIPTLVYGQRNTENMLSGYKSSVVGWTCRHQADGIVVNSQATRRKLVSEFMVTDEKIRVIYNGINIPQLMNSYEVNEFKMQAGLPHNRLLVGIVAMLRPVKNMGLLIQAAHMLHEEPVDFVVVGEGPERSRLMEMVRSFGLESRFHFAGAQKDTIPWIQAFDIGVLCSETEGLPNAVLEYMACGRPVVSTNVGGLDEIVVNQETGMLVAPDNASALAGAIRQLLCNKQMRDSMGTSGRERAATTFSLQQEIDNHVRAYHSWLKGTY
jgi:glycosyltransferase involved in cell wall biosynthesis